MAMTIDQWFVGLQIQAAARWDAPGSVSGGTVSDPRFIQTIQMAFTLTDGTGSGKVDTLVFQERQLAASASESLNLFDGSVLDVKGAATGLSLVKCLVIWQVANPDASTAASSFTVGAAASNQLALNFGSVTDTWTGYKDATPFRAGRPAGYTVDNTHKLLKVLNNDGANVLTYLLAVAGNHV